jgi:hypothetical protein
MDGYADGIGQHRFQGPAQANKSKSIDLFHFWYRTCALLKIRVLAQWRLAFKERAWLVSSKSDCARTQAREG